jgi:hypothetical protein
MALYLLDAEKADYSEKHLSIADLILERHFFK